MAEDYGLKYYAAFVGCSAETEASFETIVFLAGKVDELSLHSILQIESAKGDLARTIRENTQTKDQQILTMNSLQSATLADSKGDTYLSVMTDNLEVLRQALA
jgi:zinc transport system substrate-binding protein